MNPGLAGLYVGKALAEGDYLAAAPFLTDIWASLKTTVTTAAKQAGSAELARIQGRLAPAMLPTDSAGPMPDTAPSPASVPPRGPGLLPLVALGVGGYLLMRHLRRRS